MSWREFKPYVSVAQKRAKAAREAARLAKNGRKLEPIRIEGKKIAETFWGEAWCEHLESYSDYENRLPRGRTYVRNGSVIDLQIMPGRIEALVSGSEIYTVEITIAPLQSSSWKRIKSRCSGQIGSLVELLQGRLSAEVMDVVTHWEEGMFPKPKEIKMKCSCPDWAGVCKHVAAVVYGIGARLDSQPELLFKLRKVDHGELIETAGAATFAPKAARGKKTLAASELGAVFGIEMHSDPAAAPPTPSVNAPKPRANRKPKKSAAIASGGESTLSASTVQNKPADAVKAAVRKQSTSKKKAVAVVTRSVVRIKVAEVVEFSAATRRKPVKKKSAD